jgi:HEAT repeat protein
MRRRLGFAVLTTVVLLSTAACEKDPHDAQTWIDKLGNRADLNESLRNLERLKDPKSIKPLGKAWKKHNKHSAVLRTMITIAGHPDPKTKEQHWADAIDFLIDAVDSYDPGDQRSIEDAGVACDALGRAGDPKALDILIKTANKPMPRLAPENHVRVSAVRALGKFKDPRAVDLLMKILETDPEKQVLKLNAAAALALAETGDPKALPALTKALFIGPLFQQVRRAITRVGKPTVPAMMEMYQHKNPEVEEMFKAKNWAQTAPGIIEYNAAVILGDLRGTEAIPLLVAGLKSEAKISYFDPKSGAAGPTTHAAILDSLRHMAFGNKEAADAVKAYWKDPKTDDFVRPMAYDVYSMLTRETTELDTLFKIVSDENAEDQMRAAAALAYGRLGRTADHAKRLDALIAKYDDTAKKSDEKAKAAKNDADKAGAEAERDRANLWKQTLVEASYRLSVGVQCQDDAACYMKFVGARDVSVGQPGLPKAERALLEIAKMGKGAQSVQEQLLGFVDTREGFVREGVLLALPMVVGKPCAACVDRMADVIDKQRSESTLDRLTGETQVVYNYFLWAGK